MDEVTATRMIGGTPGKKRSMADYYPTPADVTQALLDMLLIQPGTKVWEPACGGGHMVQVLEANGLKVTATDIETGTDFLTAELPEGTEWIITNPPFSLANEFIETCIKHKRPFALLTKSQFWHAKKRYDLFLHHPPRWILPLTWRPDFNFLDRKEGERGNSLMDVCWCVWDGAPVFTHYMPLRRPGEDKT